MSEHEYNNFSGLCDFSLVIDQIWRVTYWAEGKAEALAPKVGALNDRLNKMYTQHGDNLLLRFTPSSRGA